MQTEVRKPSMQGKGQQGDFFFFNKSWAQGGHGGDDELSSPSQRATWSLKSHNINTAGRHSPPRSDHKRTSRPDPAQPPRQHTHSRHGSSLPSHSARVFSKSSTSFLHTPRFSKNVWLTHSYLQNKTKETQEPTQQPDN